MFKAFLKYAAKAAAVIAPLVIPWLLKINVAASLGLAAVVSDEMLRGSVSVLALGFAFVGDALNLQIPQDEAKRFGRSYVTQVIDNFEKNLPPPLRLGSDLRVNVMLARRSWWMLYIGRVFNWYANKGFDPAEGTHRDAHLFLFSWQGVAATALKDENTVSVDLRGTDLKGDFTRFPWWKRLLARPFGVCGFGLRLSHVLKTHHLRAILSIPLFRQTHPAPNPRWKAVGVINVDAVSELGAAYLMRDDTARAVSRYFSEYGTVVAFFAK